ncbi:MAG: PAS domain S-box protein [Candidatus Riflebacteria bacterium]|nr:PAS domain S-box protein [Candidatus Riflebacteria bacterium]
MTAADLGLLLAFAALIAALVAARRQHTAEIAQIRSLERETFERKQYYRTVFANAGVGILRLDPLGAILEANEAFQEFSGYSYEELKTRSLASLAHPDDREGMTAAAAAGPGCSAPAVTGGGTGEADGSVAGAPAGTGVGAGQAAGAGAGTGSVARATAGNGTGQPGESVSQRGERRFVRKDGTWRWGDVRTSVIRGPDGGFQAFIAVVVDITERKAAELIFQEGQEKLQQITENLGAAVFQMRRRPDGTPWFTFLNEEAERIVGISRGRLLERAETFFELIEPEDRAAIERSMAEASRRQEKWSGDFRLRRPDIGMRWLFGRAVPQRGPDGETVWNGYFSDNTERRQLDQKFRAIFDSSFDAYFLVDPKGRALDCNSTAIKLFRASGRDEILTLGPLGYLPEQQPDGGRSYDRFQDLLARTLAAGHGKGEWRFRVRGQEMPADLTMIRLEVVQPPIVLVVVHDLTERKKAEATIVESRNLLRGVIDNSMAVICAKDTDGRYLLVNRRWGEILDLSEAEVVGRTDAEIFPADQALDYRRNDLQVLQTGKPLTIEEHALIDGERRTFLAVKFPIIDRAGQVNAVCGISTDITDLKKIHGELSEARQQADAANQAKSQFLANMSHEIRTPMNAIMGFAYLALQSDPSPALRGHLEKIQNAAKGLLGIINDVLDFSKIEVGKLTIEAIEFDLERVLDNVSGMITLRAQEKGIELVLDLDPALPRRLIGDPLRLEQVLVNLTSNAVKFTKAGEIVVGIRLVGAPAPRDGGPAESGEGGDGRDGGASGESREGPAERIVLEFRVRDTGVGLTAEQISHLFQPFTQADGSTTRKYGGTGLGLSICKRLVEMMHGTIGVSSQPGKGSTFTFTAEFGQAETGGVPTPLPDLRQLRVLVVDDHPASREYLARVLTALSFEVVEARDGQEALEILERPGPGRPIELILMDWQMPGLDGIETSRRIQALGGPAKAPTIIMVTAFGRDRAMAHAGDVPIDEYLVKPVTPSTLFEAILRVFKKEHPGRQAAVSGAEPPPDLDRLVGARALLVEDNELNQEVAVTLLTRAGMVVETAVHGREALDRLARAPFDVVLMDCQMPEMDGYECTGEIRRQSRFARLPVIAMTANAVAGDRERCLAAGMNDHLAKPIDPAALFQMLLRWLPAREGASPPADSRQAGPVLPAAVPTAAGDRAGGAASRGGVVPPMGGGHTMATVATGVREAAGPSTPAAGAVPAGAGPSGGEVLPSVDSVPVGGSGVTSGARGRSGTADRSAASDSGDGAAGGPVAPAPPIPGGSPREGRTHPERGPAGGATGRPVPTGISATGGETADLAKITGIDLPSALARLGGDAALLRGLLRKFRSRNLDFGEQVMRAVNQDRWDDARRLAHTLKGVAATIGARGLPDLAAELESQLLARQREGITPALMATQAGLLALCAQIEDLSADGGALAGPGVAAGPTSPAGLSGTTGSGAAARPAAGMPPGARSGAADLGPLLERLRQALAADDAEAIPLFDQVRAGLAGLSQHGAILREIGTKLDAYAFEEAVPLVEALARELARIRVS